MASVSFYLAAALIAIIYYYYKKLNKDYGYFKDRGIPQIQTETFYGNAKDVIQQKIDQGSFYTNVYNKFKKMGVSQGGIYVGKARVWVPINIDLIKSILTKDFVNFSAHFPHYYQNTSVMTSNVFMMDGEEWRDIRRKLSPTFTSGKMKSMYNIMLEKSNGLSKLVEKFTATGEPVDMQVVFARYTTDIIGSCAFGIEGNSLVDQDSEFFRQGQGIFRDETEEKKKFSLVRTILANFGLSKPTAHIDFSETDKFFSTLVADTIDYREKHKIIRKDFMHLMIQLKNKGVVTELTNENEDVYKKTVENEGISQSQIVGQSVLFFTAGFETSATTLTYALLELSQNPDIQKKLRSEIRDVLKKHNGLTYEAIQDMTYCENVLSETLRKFPVVPFLPRVCTKNYTIPGTNSVVEAGTTVNIPVTGIQRDPDYFPEPEKFDPDRFLPENKHKIKEFTYMPFGEGPRMCLGLRFGKLQSKVGLVNLINNFNFTFDKKTIYPPQYVKSQNLIAKPEGGVWLRVTKAL